MNSAWNLLGIAMWLIVAAFFIFMIHNIRTRQLRIIVKSHKRFTWGNFWLSCCLVVISVASIIGASYLTFFRDVDLNNQSEVSLKYTSQPLILTPSTKRSYYVKVVNGNGKTPVQYYTYLVKGAQYEVSSVHATVVYGIKPSDINATKYPFSQTQLQKLDMQTGHAFVYTVKATYKDNLINGLGIRAGQKATTFSLIRIPDQSFMKLEKSN